MASSVASQTTFTTKTLTSSTPTSFRTITSTSSSSETKSPTPVLNFETPALTTVFTPPATCTQGQLTMLMSAAYQVWLNEPRPVPNTTFSGCYPSQFMTSFLASARSTIQPAFSPLVCPDNYFTIFNRTVTSRPLYVACCPSGFGFHPPDTSTPGRPGYGGTCFSDILSQTVTQYDNSSSSGVMIFSTTGQAYAHPIDGFALQTPASAISKVTVTEAASSATSSPISGVSSADKSNLNVGMITGIVVGLGLGLGLILASIFFIIRSRKHRDQKASEESCEHVQEAVELPSPTTLMDMPAKKSSELPESQESLPHELPHDREFPLELDGGSHNRQSVTSANSVSGPNLIPLGHSKIKR